MFGSMKVFCGMLVLRRIATSNVAAGQAQPQMNPRVARFQTFFATVAARLHFPNLFHV
jgi:hypothetical protein